MKQKRKIGRQRKRRALRVRSRVKRVAERHRLCVFRSRHNCFAQIVDDHEGKTLAAAGTLDKELRKEIAHGGNKTAAAAVGKAVAQRALAAGVKEVVFDRREYKYHGRVAALADAAREGGLVF